MTETFTRKLMTTSLLASLLASSPAFAGDGVTLGNVKVERGGRATASLHLNSTQPLTLLSVDLGFAPKLCTGFRNQSVSRSGRSAVDPQEGAVRCPEDGRVSIVLMDLLGKVAIPAGTGPVAQWSFDVAPTVKPGTYPVEVTVRQANNGPAAVALTATAGSVNVTR